MFNSFHYVFCRLSVLHCSGQAIRLFDSSLLQHKKNITRASSTIYIFREKRIFWPAYGALIKKWVLNLCYLQIASVVYVVRFWRYLYVSLPGNVELLISLFGSCYKFALVDHDRSGYSVKEPAILLDTC